VLQADGGTRTASVTGGFVALAIALKRLKDAGRIDVLPLSDYVAAVSVGVVSGTALLDLQYSEDSRADVDMNVVKTRGGLYIEVQGTAETGPFSEVQMREMLDLASRGIEQLVEAQRAVLGGLGIEVGLSGMFNRG
jgi:ribonuclease PH